MRHGRSMRQIIADDRRDYEKRKKEEAAAEKRRLEQERYQRELDERKKREEAEREERHRLIEAETAEWRERYEAADSAETKASMSRELIRDLSETVSGLIESQRQREECAAVKKENEAVRSVSMTTFDLDDFKKTIADDFRAVAMKAAKATRACRDGADQANKDAMIEGYRNGLDVREITDSLEHARKDEQMRFRGVYDSGRAAASEYVDKAFALNPDEYADVAPMLSVVKLNESDVRTLLKEHGGSWTKRRAIVDAACASGVTGAEFMRESMSEYEAKVREQSLGIFESARKGVLGSLDNWDVSFDSRMDSMATARKNLDIALGIEDAPTHWMADAMESAAWKS